MIKRAILFSGQGAQYKGMCRNLLSESAVARDVFTEASDVLGFDMGKLCLDSTAADLALTANTQPAIMTVSIAQYRTLQERERLTADVMAGHSLGELSALCAAGAYSFADAVRIARLRGELMQNAVPVGKGAMLAIGTRVHDEVAHLCEQASELGVVSISNLNSNTQVVVSGEKKAVGAVQDAVSERGWPATLLNVSVPFHCTMMEPVVEPLRDALRAIKITDPAVPVLSNVTADVHGGKKEIIDLLGRQVVETVRWVDCMTWMRLANIGYAVEVGPGSTLAKLMRHTYGLIPVFPYDDPEAIADLHLTIRQATIPFAARALGMAASTRNTNTDVTAYRAGVIEPYAELRKMNNALLKEGREANEAEQSHILDLLRTIMDTKGVPAAEQRDRLRELFRDSGTEDLHASFNFAEVGQAVS